MPSWNGGMGGEGRGRHHLNGLGHHRQKNGDGCPGTQVWCEPGSPGQCPEDALTQAALIGNILLWLKHYSRAGTSILLNITFLTCHECNISIMSWVQWQSAFFLIRLRCSWLFSCVFMVLLIVISSSILFTIHWVKELLILKKKLQSSPLGGATSRLLSKVQFSAYFRVEQLLDHMMDIIFFKC